MICKPGKLIITDGDLVFSYDVAAASMTSLSSAVGRRLSEVVSTALKESHAHRREKILLLSASLFRQLVRLPKTQTEGLAPAELESLLAFEVEPFSNLSRGDGALAYRSLHGEDSIQGAWDVLQIARSELAGIQRAAKNTGCVLLGVAGLPAGWSLSDQAALSVQAGAVISQLAGGTAPFPVLAPPRGGGFAKNPFTIAVIVVLLLLGLCAADYIHLTARISLMAPLVEERQRLSDENSALANQIRSKENAIRAHEEERKERELSMKEVEQLESAWGEALSAMARLFGENAVITSIHSDEDFRAVVEGVGASYKDVGEEFVRLAGPLSESGWKLLPGSISERSDGNTVHFSFMMVHKAAKEKKVPSSAGGSYYDDFLDD